MEYYSANKNDEIMLKLQHRDCSEWSKSDRGEISYDIPYVQNLKRNDTNEITKQKQTHSLREQAPGCQGGRTEGSDRYGVWDWHVSTAGLTRWRWR